MRSTVTKTGVGILLAASLLASVPGAEAAIVATPTATAMSLVSAMMNPLTGMTVTSASFAYIPTATAKSAGVGNAPVTFFPSEGPEYAILSSGSAACVEASPSCSEYNSWGGSWHGGLDTVQLRIDFTVPAYDSWLCFHFQFMSEEYPEYVGTIYNDGFVAELDANTWSVSFPVLTAPDNFAVDAFGNPITINAASMSSTTVSGTDYDGGTAKLIAKTPVTPGPHTLWLAVYDSGDTTYDTTVLLDNLRTGQLETDPTKSFFERDCESAPTPDAEFSYEFTTTGTQLAPGYGGPYDLTLDDVQFTDETFFPPWPGAVNSWWWEFGDMATDGIQHPLHPYDDDGTYTVCLTAKITIPSGLSRSDKVCHDITVNNRAPISKFVHIGAEYSVYFKFREAARDMDGQVVAWEWDFGDGTTSTLKQPPHYFPGPGKYVVCLKVTDDDGATDTFCEELFIEELQRPDTDADGLWDDADNCPDVPNYNQFDVDDDGRGDVCDQDYVPGTQPDEPIPDPERVGSEVDSDHDGVFDSADNCVQVPNHDQKDLDKDALGDACDADVDGDGVPNVAVAVDGEMPALDNCPVTINAAQEDTDGDGLGNACDASSTLVALNDKVALEEKAAGGVAGEGGQTGDAVPATGWDAMLASPAGLAVLVAAGLAILMGVGGVAYWSVKRWR